MIIDARWEIYEDFIQEHSNYEKIFVTDTRDVIFQSDLFASYANYKNFLVYATEAMLIKDDPGNHNQSWIRHLFGENEYQKLAEKIIICCGTVLGTRSEMNIFFERMIEILKRSTMWGDEQAATNYLVHNKLLNIKNLIASDIKSGEILTTGLIQNIGILNEKILRGDGKIPAVVHQYDRQQGLIQLVDKVYREKDFQADENFTDVLSAIDQIFCLVQRQNFNTATKFFVDYILYAKNLNIYGEKLLKLYQFILQRYNPDAEILLLAIQRTLVSAFVAGINIQQLENVYQIFVITEKKIHVINSSFKNFVKNMLMNFIDIFYKNNQQNFAREYIKRLSDWRGLNDF